MSRFIVLAALAAALGFQTAAAADRASRPADARVYIVWPKDGMVIHGGKLWVRMGLRGMGVAPAKVNVPNTGHHHLLVDTELPPLGEPIPSDRNHLHFGGGQTEARLEDLAPGRHTLQLLFADHQHVPHDPPLHSEKITIVVPPY